MPLDFTSAFGGPAFGPNPVGKGFVAPGTKPNDVVGMPLPEITNSRALASLWNVPQTPAALGFISKSWQPRAAQLGTYDANWKALRAPHAPEDFLLDFYNATARDQQVDGYLHGNEKVSLRHIGPHAATHFTLPGVWPQITVVRKSTDLTRLDIHLDTLCIIADQSMFYLVWRGAHLVDDAGASDVAALRITQAPKQN